MNPFEQKTKSIEHDIVDWKTLAGTPYEKASVDPYTRLRVILMGGTEFESVWLGHQFSRHCDNADLRREIALIRRVEQQQQKRIAGLKPADESILEHTIGYEMLAVDLTCALAKQEPDTEVQNALNFALLEDFDHLYRYANLLEGECGIDPATLVGRYTEIMPGRPTISEHRHPYDDLRRPIGPKAALATKLNVGIITAAEQQTMNYYMNVGSFYDTEAGRQLYSEIAMIEEQHVTHYGSLKDPNMSWLACLLMHEYTECYLYASCMESETDPKIKTMWEEFYEQECAHLHRAAALLEQYDGCDYHELLPDAEFPQLLTLASGADYVRHVLTSVQLTSCREDYARVEELSDDADFFRYQELVNRNVAAVPSHKILREYLGEHKTDYRIQREPHPVAALDDRTHDNTTVGRTPEGK